MSIPLICQCGERYELKDEFLGKLVKCPKCGNEMIVSKQPLPIERAIITDPIFDRDRFLLRQRHFAIAEKYFVYDDKGNKLIYIERPAYHLLHFLALICGIISGIIVMGSAFLGSIVVQIKVPVLTPILLFLAILISLFTIFVVFIGLYRKRHIYFYRDDTKKELILKVLQDNKIQIFNAYYSIVDAQDNLLARIRKNFLYNLFRRRWYGNRADGTLLFIAREDSFILSLLRRLLGNLFGILRTNFEIIDEDGNTLGEFNRKFTILDRYVLDMSNDPNRKIDRRIALALGVLLDTGERR